MTSNPCIAPGLEALSIPTSHTPVPSSEDGEPLTDVQAYVAGFDVSRSGMCLADVVYVAFASGPGSAREVCEAVASASIGWCADRWRAAEP
jgi:hypothetical protein